MATANVESRLATGVGSHQRVRNAAKLGVEVHTNSRVEATAVGGVQVSGTPAIARAVFWVSIVVGER